ncbi:MAG: Uma2 family endonuclease [Armatimonadetes bacterium]|nr:Uma2 family endonuclease [Anaerolineae bacterium]
MDTPTTQEKFISADAFWDIIQTPEYADKNVELIEGVIVEMSPTSWKHGNIALFIATPLQLFVVARKLGYVSVEAGYLLFKNPDGKDTIRAPDVSFAKQERAPQGIPDEGYVPYPPDLAVEVVSPNDKMREISTKVGEYLRAGTPLVWIVDPYTQTVIVHRLGSIAAYDVNGILDGGDVLPGFTLPVRDIFPET